MKKNNKNYSYGAILFRKEKNVIYILLVKHKQGHWGIPKGHREKNEKIVDTIKREVFEETGINNFTFIKNKHLIENYNFKDGNVTIKKQVKYYLCEVKNKKINIQFKNEIIKCKWFESIKSITQATHESTKNLLKNFNKIIH
ncbi:MAG: NUDIX hydrolase [Berkelbacteria bacterium GW2011_GWA2_35_9]|uniref:NUDIX hydrolase n=1 Tax=Berkelbacteria bacterium GW2011_GWA2_35_9 TaxID=1618333 RepID=A0A0G0FJR5_9BACT|nr:MAG: NUDIX hydrolase [Berkelbacteria bacterium GW2011_GWA2_35_9]